ncbi:ornithine cyclodeaminase family protein [Aquisalimonas lutea]|uniref:iminosuccinate reductase BhcD n=1 Tax=Aquisalimonas lutea TaxID=1327750 RepID=UPI0025B46587|nr:iminosuccinate reductase BhcD [Aquisalimonas lutea]MDN3518136.1 ornithine cyclodeaminase family protein [Aquisalimonas lutea]
MLIISEQAVRDSVGRADAAAAVESVFAAMAAGDARNFPVVREAIGHADALYGFKSGFDRGELTLGVKSGGYWPGNAARGLTNHQSTVLLFDPDTGQPRALVGGNYLTALRTAAASAVSIRHLARPDAATLGIVGAGHQAPFQLRAALEERRFQRVVAWNRSPERLNDLAAAAAEAGVAFETVDRDTLCRQADVIITITSCFEPLLSARQIRPGTHIACMGTDTAGKQEIDPAILAAAEVFTDEVAQAAGIGECQHAVAQGLIAAEAIRPVGDVIRNADTFARAAGTVTVFDGTGVGLQDLAVARVAVERAVAAGSAVEASL